MGSRLQGKVAFITGAARGQGRAEAVLMAQEGADIVALDICAPIEHRDSYPSATRSDLDQTVALVTDTGRRIVAVQGDIRNFDDVSSAVEQGLAAFGRLDVVIANAGITGAFQLAHEISEESWQTTVDINLTGTWLTAKAALPAMINAGNGGSIIIVSSGAGERASRHLADYGAVKAGLLHFTRILALENGEHRIRVNSITPGAVDTPMVMNEATFRLFRPDLEAPALEDVEPLFLDRKPLRTKSFIAARDLAYATLWLASDESACVTGSNVRVDMGEALM